MFSLSVVCLLALMLVTSSMLISADVVNSTSEFEYVVITCTDSDLHLKCDTGVILATSATYGRQNDSCRHTQPQNEIYPECKDSPKFFYLCNGLAECVLTRDQLESFDPCLLSFNYYNITHVCIPTQRSVTCEGDEKDFGCEQGVIAIIDANYGRTDQTTCSKPKRKPNRHQNTNCLAPESLSTVSDSCEGAKSCTVTASNEMFDDPCVGTRKYLNISYYCTPEES
ncbi:L-rhamnose-binding lectin CSL2 [Danio rerio]|uniref:L-rhamnose-binding lectin CSL2 isoform X1 n=1 Tax=Danio rerio TaxID=7955 RepID=B0S5U6_DANRE|nr:L-rhamnose-binding lectin CSL3 [Danio rerio]|eukprot:XP_017213244.1 L-rhamnose-binding lectin CSL3 [Danio rerio]